MTFFTFMSFQSSIKVKNRLLWISIILWILVFGLRGYYVGNDTPGYAQFFSGIRYLRSTSYGTVETPNETLEPGFLFIANILHILSDNPTIIFLIHATLLFIVWGLYLKKNNPQNALWCLLIFFVMNSGQIINLMVALRQSLSVCFLVLGVYIYENNKNLIYNTAKRKWYANKSILISIILILFAITIHRTSILIFPIIILLFFIKIPRNIAYISITCCSIISIILPNFYSTFFDMILSSIISIEDEKVALLGTRYADSFSNANVHNLIFLLSRPIIAMLLIYHLDKRQLSSIAYNCLVVSTIISSILNQSSMMSRLVLVFTVLASSVFIPNTIIKNKKLRIIFILITVLYLFKSYQTFSNWDTKNETCLPYHFVWE